MNAAATPGTIAYAVGAQLCFEPGQPISQRVVCVWLASLVPYRHGMLTTFDVSQPYHLSMSSVARSYGVSLVGDMHGRGSVPNVLVPSCYVATTVQVLPIVIS